MGGWTHVVQLSHGIVLPSKLHYSSWGDGVGNSMFPNQVPNREPDTCDVVPVQTIQTPQCLIWNVLWKSFIHNKKYTIEQLYSHIPPTTPCLSIYSFIWPYLKLHLDFSLICIGISACDSLAYHPWILYWEHLLNQDSRTASDTHNHHTVVWIIQLTLINTLNILQRLDMCFNCFRACSHTLYSLIYCLEVVN